MCYHCLSPPWQKVFFTELWFRAAGPKKSSVQHAGNYYDDEAPGHPQSSCELLLQLFSQENPTLNRNELKQLIHKLTSKEIVDYLKQQSYQSIEKAYLILEEKYRGSYYKQEKLFDTKLGRHIHESSHSAPKLFCDGVVLTDLDVKDTIAAKKHNDVPVLIGSNRDESTTFQILDPEFVSAKDGSYIVKDPARYALVNEYVSNLWGGIWC